MDIHDFKIINSICGIIKGDETLKNIWRCIEKSLTSKDLAGHINADRFAIYCRCDDKDEVIECIHKIGEGLKDITEALKIPNIIPYYGISHWKHGKKVEEAYSEANLQRIRLKSVKI